MVHETVNIPKNLWFTILTRTNDISAKETKLNEDMFTNVENTLKDKEIDLSYTQLVKQLIHEM